MDRAANSTLTRDARRRLSVGGLTAEARARAWLWLLLLRVGALAAALSGVLTFVVAPLRGQFHGEFEDYRAYLDAATAVRTHTDVYSQFLHQTPNVALSGFDYPPIVGWLLQPLAWLPGRVASTLWLWVLIACTAVAITVTVRELLPRHWPRWEIATLVTVAYAPATYNYWHGNMNAVIFLLVALALRSWIQHRQGRCGVLIGIAASIKLAPIVLVILLLRARWWRGAGSALITVVCSAGAGLALLGTATSREWLTGVLPVLSRQDGWLYNQSLGGAVNRVFAHSVLAPQPASLAVSVVTGVLSVAALAMLVTAASPRLGAPEMRGAQFGVGVLVMLLVGSLAWYAHLVSALVSLVAAAGLVAAGHARRLRLVVAAAAIFLVANGVIVPWWLALVGAWPQVVALSHSAWFYVITQLASLPAASAVFLAIALTAHLRSTSPKPRGVGGALRWTPAETWLPWLSRRPRCDSSIPRTSPSVR